MPDAMKIVSAFTSGLVAAVRLLVPVGLGGMLLWVLFEMMLSLSGDKEYGVLALFPLAALIGVLVVTLWRCMNPGAFGLVHAYNGSMNVMPLLLLDLLLILAAVWISDRFGRSLTTPLLSFSQAIFHKLTS
jgi:hypothetical protein